jgi:hypothetical protein
MDTVTKRKIDDALRIGNELAQSKPNDSSLRSILEQLAYLKQIYDRDHSLRAITPGKMTIGVIAAKEFDVSHPRFAKVLYEIDYALDHPD